MPDVNCKSRLQALLFKMEMPKDWSDAAGWDAYYSIHIPNFENVEKYDLEQDLRFVATVLEAPHKRIWFPGCGLDLAPWLYANLGCDVVATDISSFAIRLQNELLFEDPMEVLEKLPNVLKEMELPKANRFVHPAMFVHDMRQPFTMPQVDVVLNRRAFLGFSEEEMEGVARNFFDAIYPGGTLIMDSPNIQGADRTLLEMMLSKAGFFIPGLETEQWYRTQLDGTGIPYRMVLGSPMIAKLSEYNDKGGKQQAEKDLQTIRSFRTEYLDRCRENAKSDENAFRAGIDKVAYIVYVND